MVQPKINLENIQVVQWKGIKNCDTNQTTQGYLFVKFLSDTKLLNINPNVIGAKEKTYLAGNCIGFSINAPNRKLAIELFSLHYQICH